MFKFKLALILIIFWVIAGCQQSYNKVASNGSVKPLTNSAKTTDRSTGKTVSTGTDSSIKLLETTSLESDAGPVEQNEPSLISESNLKITNNGSEKANTIAQEKIDQALELCNYAQQMWEKGKLDEALANLDSAYYSTH